MNVADAKLLQQAPSKREIQVLTLVAQGRWDEEIAEALAISLATVRVYRKRLKAKLGTVNTMQTVLVAWRRGHLHLAALADEAVEVADGRPKI